MEFLKNALPYLGGCCLTILILLAILWWLLTKDDAKIFEKIEQERKTREDLLFSLERDNDEIVREAAAIALGEMRAIEVDENLVTALQHEKSQRVRLAIINALIPITNHLIEYAEISKDIEPMKAPVLTTQGSPEHYLRAIRNYIVPELTKALYSENREEREAATMALLWIGTREALDAIEASPNSALPPQPIAKSNKDVQFSVYYPSKVQVNSRYTIYLYAYEQENLLSVFRDVVKSRDANDAEVLRVKKSKQGFKLPRNTPITVVPECDGIQFEPSSCTEIWDGNWTRFNIYFEPKASSVNEHLLVRFSIRVGSIEIAHIVSEIDVVEQILDSSTTAPTHTNPLASAKFNSHTFLPYQKIFVSYSRKDVDIVEMYRRVQDALGNDVFIDTYSIRSGVNWRAALAKAIDTADIFQLFWSKNSAESPNVRDEWDYALKYKCPKNRCESFIRPVYWVIPIPAEPPDELKHLNFRYVPLEIVKSTTK